MVDQIFRPKLIEGRHNREAKGNPRASSDGDWRIHFDCFVRLAQPGPGHEDQGHRKDIRNNFRNRRRLPQVLLHQGELSIFTQNLGHLGTDHTRSARTVGEV